MAGLGFRRWPGKITESWRRNDCRFAAHRATPHCRAALRNAALHFAPQRNAPLGSLEPLMRLRDAEGYQHRALALRGAAPRAAPQRNANLEGTRYDPD